VNLTKIKEQKIIKIGKLFGYLENDDEEHELIITASL
jgi:hypothetical protein